MDPVYKELIFNSSPYPTMDVLSEKNFLVSLSKEDPLSKEELSTKHLIHFFVLSYHRSPNINGVSGAKSAVGNISLARFVKGVHSPFLRVPKQQVILKMGNYNFPCRIRCY